LLVVVVPVLVDLCSSPPVSVVVSGLGCSVGSRRARREIAGSVADAEPDETALIRRRT
jgi:hypothetical protein